MLIIFNVIFNYKFNLKFYGIWNMSLEYMTGFGNDFQTEALPGALPQGQNSPQICHYKL